MRTLVFGIVVGPAIALALCGMAGATALIPPDSSPQPPTIIQFASQKFGWLIDPTHPGRILGTSDGGRKWWTSFDEPVGADGTNGTVKSIDFVNTSDGWALVDGRGLMVTHDGGHKWSTPQQPTQGAVVTMTFTGVDDGWAITDQGVLLRTINGDRTWVAERTPEPALTECVSETGNVWIGGGSGNIYESGEGESWGQSLSGSVVRPPSFVGESAATPTPWLACAAEGAWALYQYGESAGSDPFIVERTLNTDGQWKLLATPSSTSLVPPQPQISMNTPSEVGATAPTNAWILGYCGPCSTGSASVVIAANGSTFSGALLSAAPGIYASPIGVTFLSPQRGWAVLEEYPSSKPGVASAERTVVVRTTDGGAKWMVTDERLFG